jgi:hypothetical protein
MLTDDRIERLLEEEKASIDARAFRSALATASPRRSQRRAKTKVRGESGTTFILHLRQNVLDAYDFSVILAYLPQTGAEIILRRHNGRNHRHRNHLEGSSFTSSFHIHYATERYQAAGFAIDGYAERTDAFHDLATALDAMLRVANFEPPAQTSIRT